jgi:hypothetical protein
VDGRITDSEILSLVDLFVKERIIYWIEALSYIGYLMEGRESIVEMSELLPVG